MASMSTEFALECDRSGLVVWADDRANSLVADIAGRRLDDAVVMEDRPKVGSFLEAAWAADEGQGSASWEIGIVRPSGPATVRLRGAPRLGHVLIVGSVLPGDYGLLAADAGQLMQELLLLQRESERQRRELAEASEALRQAQAELVQGEQLRSLGLLVASVAHEVNNPLAFAVAGVEEADRLANFALSLLTAYRSNGSTPGALDLIAEMEADPEAAYVDDLLGTLADARDGLERVRTLVLDLRTFVRVDEAEGKPIDLAATLRATLRIGRTAVMEGVRVQVELADMPPLECAPARVNQAVLNLFTNAARAAAPKGTVRVRLYERENGAVVEVDDSGPGVPEEMRERIFEPFYTTKGATGGLGLGLHLAREAARAQHGDLTVGQSELGGALFTLTLPRSTRVPAL